MSIRNFCSTLVVLLLTQVVVGQDAVRIELAVAAPEYDACNVPLHATISLPDSLASVPAEQTAVSMHPPGVAARTVPGQLVRDGDSTELWWLAPELKKGQASKWAATLRADPAQDRRGFTWRDTPGQHRDLLWNERPVLRYMYAHDPSTEQTLFETYKVYHHVFDASGKNLLTNGPGGLYPHHRGIFVGWNKTKVGDNEYDFWHMKSVTQRHDKVLYQTAGPVLARMRTLIYWVGPGGKPVVSEEREVTVFKQPAPTVLLLDFNTNLTAVAGDIFLGGDPEHAGVQYRAHNDVADGDATVKATYTFHRDGIDAHTDENLPWAAMSYGLNAKRYNVQQMNHPANPTPSKYSAYRDYGRFGHFFVTELKSGETLPLHYRIVVMEGEPPARAELATSYSAFATPPQVTLVKDQP